MQSVGGQSETLVVEYKVRVVLGTLGIFSSPEEVKGHRKGDPGVIH